MDEQSLKTSLAQLPVPMIRYFDRIGSTNDEALAWAAQDLTAGGAAEGCLVVADSQERGRGRLGRHWVSRPGSSLAFSLILRPEPVEIEHLPFFSPLAGLAICQALESLGLEPQIKWPNDVLLDRKKTAGILVEVIWSGADLQAVVIGAGVNVAPESVPPETELLFPATSVQDAAAKAAGAKPVVDRDNLLQAILANLFAWRARLSDPAFLQAWEKRLAFRGEWVRVEETGSDPLTGQVVGIDAGGGLLLRTAGGENRSVQVGDVHLRPLDPSG